MKNLRALRIEGGLFSPDLLEQLDSESLPKQKPSDFGFKDRAEMTSTLAALFNEARTLWSLFQQRRERLRPGESDTTITRRWMTELLELLGYTLTLNRTAYQLGGSSLFISHRAGDAEFAPPVHIVGASQDLDKSDPNVQLRRAPHTLLQEFLNRSDALWGIATNGLTLRLLRDSARLRKLAYVEFDLQAMFEGQQFDAFVLFYRLLHRSRLPESDADAHLCLLEQYYQHALEQGGRVREKLRDGVERALLNLANGFLRYGEWRTTNGTLEWYNPAEKTWQRIADSPHHLYQQLLRLVYRFLFLLVAEERQLMIDPEQPDAQSRYALYLQHYSVSRLRRLCEQPRARTAHTDLWRSLQALWLVFRKPNLAQQLAVAPLNGDLFHEMPLEDACIANDDLLQAFEHLVFYEDEQRVRRPVNYAALDVEELGSVYESLLELQPVVGEWGRANGEGRMGNLRFEFAEGTERRSTGSYYTPPELVAELIESALKPAVENAQDILQLKILDPACGSGHFLLAAARALGRELARQRCPDAEPSPNALREATREVIRHCIYGVDKNPLAVELCKVALWLESHAPGKPLTFLDHHIRCGDSLVGVFDLSVLQQGVPDKAFEPLSDDDARIAEALKRRNREERTGQRALFHHNPAPDAPLAPLAHYAQQLDALPDDTPQAVQQKQTLYEQAHADPEYTRLKNACDLWCAAFFQHFQPNTPVITTAAVQDQLANRPVDPQTLAYAHTLAEQLRFFHWQLEFPEVFQNGGFDVVLGNPPWEMIQLDPEEFFSVRMPEIAQAPNMAKRRKMIDDLKYSNQALYEEFIRAQHQNDSLKRFLHVSGRFPLTGRGRLNMAYLFAELMYNLASSSGMAGLIVPTGMMTDSFAQMFSSHLLTTGAIKTLFDFENRQALFPSVHRSYRFSLITLSKRKQEKSSFAFYLSNTTEVKNEARRFYLSSEDVKLINPNTNTCPVFRTKQDAELTRELYRRLPVLVNEATGDNPWSVKFQLMFMMNTDSHLFRTRAELEAEGYRLVGNRFVQGERKWLPLYEAKMIWHYDHRFGTYAGVADRTSTHLPTPTPAQYADPSFLVQPWYWVEESEVLARLPNVRNSIPKWLLSFRNVANATNERTIIFSLQPQAGLGHTGSVLFLSPALSAKHYAAFTAVMNSLSFDYVIRQKISGMYVGYFVFNQLPVPRPDSFTEPDFQHIIPRVLELVYTAWDMKPFADDVWREADGALREAIRRQWEANRAATGGCAAELPAWAAAYPELTPAAEGAGGIPLPPFRWDADRRARLKAELDAHIARLYGLTRKQLRYLLDPADLTENELKDITDPREEIENPLDPAGYAARAAASRFPGETFRVLKEKELRQYGEYRTRRLVLEAWEAGSPATLHSS
jgi:hypothetical protein